MRAAIYARVSSAGQRDRHTIESQLRVLPAFVAAQGWDLVRTETDDGRSAATGKLDARDGFARLAAAADRGELDVVAVVDLSRLTRTDDMRERADILGRFQAAGVAIATPEGGVLDLRTMFGELYATLQAIFAAEERRKLIERTRQGRITAARRGRLPAGRPPWGLAFDREVGAWSIDPVRGPLVTEMFERVAAGESCRAVADDLEARGVARERGRWHRGRIATIIRDRAAAGEWTADRTRGLVVAVPPLVTEDLWQRAQLAIAATRTCRPGFRRTLGEYLLERLAVCGACGAPVGIRSRTPTSAPAYICDGRRSARKGAAGRCLAPIVPTAAADARAWAAIRRELEDPELERALAGELADQAAECRDWAADAAGYRRKLDRLQVAEQALLARFTRGAVGESALDAELARIARERSALQSQLETAGRAIATAGSAADRMQGAGAIVARLRERLADAPFPAQRALVELLVRPGGVVLSGAELRLTLWVPRPPVASMDASACRPGRGSDVELPLRIRALA